MNRIIRISLAVALGMSAIAGPLFAQQRPIPTNPATASAAASTGPAAGSGFGAFRTGPRPYKEIITDKARSQRGMVTVHKVEDKYYFELPDSILGKEILAVTRFVKVPWGGGVYGGEEANENVLTFEKGPDNKIFLRVSLNVVQSPDSTKPIYQAVKNSSVDPIAAAFDIRAFGRDSTSSIIDVTDFFRGDNQIVSLDAGTKRRFNLSGIATDRSYIENMRTYAKNVEIRSVKTFGASGSSPFASAPSPFPGGSSLPAAQAAGAVTTTINTSLLLLPAKPMARRAFDPRVGYFADRFVEFGDSSQKVDANTFITRWRLEPKDADVEKWKRGELVEPKKPIIYYIDPATPKQWRPYLIAGINDWQVAFEKAGFKNAIQGREWPVDDSSMSLEDARFSAIRYFASDIQNAYGPNVHDPRTGEILESHIGWYHNVMNLLHDWYFIQAANIDPRARSMRFNDSLMGQLVRFVSSHEIGHTLGLRHNMGSSSKTPVELLRNKAWVEAHGHTASIMDYARFNYVAQPEDNIGPAGIYPRIGDYDKWAIMWGYRYSGTDDEEEDKKRSNKLIIDSLGKNPRLWFGTETNPYDPRSQTEDLSDNNVKASEYGIKNLKRIMTNLPGWTKEEGDKYGDMERMYNQVVTQYGRYMGHVIKHIGGVYETPKSVEQEGDVYAVTPKADQKAALTFLNTNLFETPTWLLDKNLLNKFSNPVGNETVQTLQTRYLGSLLSSDRLGRLVAATNRDATAYSADEMMTDIQKSIWSELATKKPIDNYRRNLQKSYVETLLGLLPSDAPASSGIIIIGGGRGGFGGTDPRQSDVSSIARGQLSTLNAQIKAALPTTTDKMSRYHLQDVSDRISRALNPR